MLRTRSLVFTVALLTPLAALAFEGTVDYQMQPGDGKVQNVEYQIKGDKLRLNMHSPEHGDNAILIDRTANEMVILMPEKKMAMKRALPNPKSTVGKAAAGKNGTFTNTGRKETVAGHECTVYSYKSDDGEGEVCSAEGMGSFFFGSGGPRGEQPAWQQEAIAKGFFPLKTSNKSGKTGKTFSMVATKITPGTLPVSLFEVPKDYQMMGGFDPSEMQKKMMNATPAERQKMIEAMQKQYGGGAK